MENLEARRVELMKLVERLQQRPAKVRYGVKGAAEFRAAKQDLNDVVALLRQARYAK